MADRTDQSIVLGVFRDAATTERAVASLRAAGFGDDRIGVLIREDAPHPPPPPPQRGEGSTEHQLTAHVGEGAAAGAVVGGVLGAAGALLVPGIGPVLATGILAGVLSGAVVGAVAGGIVGELLGLGLSEAEAQYYESELRKGRVLVAVRADGRFALARDILLSNGAYDAGDPAEEKGDVPPLVGDLAPAAPPVILPPPKAAAPLDAVPPDRLGAETTADLGAVAAGEEDPGRPPARQRRVD